MRKSSSREANTLRHQAHTWYIHMNANKHIYMKTQILKTNKKLVFFFLKKSLTTEDTLRVNTKNPSWYCNNHHRRTTLENCTRGDTFKYRCHFPYPLPSLWDQLSKNPFNALFHSSTSPTVTLQLFKVQYSPSSPNISTIKFLSPPHNPTASFFFFFK